MNFNPINCWPTSILDLIFQNLSGDEILTATKVSPSWENYIGRSSICMTKIDLKIIGRKFYLNGQYEELKGELQKLAKSGRRYENLNFYAHKPGFLTNAVIRLLKSQKGNWKSVKIWSEKFYDEHEMEKILSQAKQICRDFQSTKKNGKLKYSHIYQDFHQQSNLKNSE
ncbi:CLUMA_CG021559, isoform A [Clunio marinus]|uniref:CLUMA_CG021559, isoform A n=1 Tax=Clunio marinus TaxID=568069 RepID=A0A1J1J8A1_9DIPT|nr:CLUMA_CG021559, isoform A [Clunio marinus]